MQCCPVMLGIMQTTLVMLPGLYLMLLGVHCDVGNQTLVRAFHGSNNGTISWALSYFITQNFYRIEECKNDIKYKRQDSATPILPPFFSSIAHSLKGILQYFL